MIRSLFIAALLILTFQEAFAGGRLIVELDHEGTAAPQALRLSGGSWRYLPGVDLYIVESEDDPVLASLQSAGAVSFSVPEAEIELARMPDDPLFQSQSSIYSEEGIGVEPVWDLAVGSESVTVALIDSGIDLDHPDLEPNLWVNEEEIPGNGLDDDRNGYVDDSFGFDFYTGDFEPMDENGHGTHLAGVIGAVGNNGEGIAGVNWDVRLMPLKFTDGNGRGTTALAIQAIDYAIENGARVINASWNVLPGEADESQLAPLRRAIERAADNGILFVTAAGNGPMVGRDLDEDPVYPAAFSLPNLLSVAALSGEAGSAGLDRLAVYSNYGSETVGLAGPGTGILSTKLGGTYGNMDGTSVAAAFVSGSAAMLISLEPFFTPEEIRGFLIGGTVPVEALDGKVASAGRLHLNRSLQVAQGNLSPIQPSTVSDSDSASSGGCSLIP